MSKKLFSTLVLSLLYTSYILACGCSPLSFGKLTMKEFNDHDIVVKAIVTEVSGPALIDKNSKKNYHVGSYDYHQLEEKPKTNSEISLKVTRTIKGNIKRNINVVMKNAEAYGYFCSYNKLEPGNSYYFFINKNGETLETQYTTRLISLKSDFGAHDYLNELKKKPSDNLDDLEEKRLAYKIEQLEGHLKTEREIKAQNLSFLNTITSNRSNKWYKEDKTLEAVGSLENGIPVGVWEYYSYSGESVEERGAFKKGKRHGVWKRYYDKSETVVEEYTYKNGLLDGKLIGYFDDGSLQSEVTYRNGKKEGVVKSYHKNGEISLVYKNKNGKLDGKRIGYLPNGEISLKENYVDGKRNGVFVRYFQTGVLKDVITYENDLPIGKYYRYFEDGSTRQEGQYSDKGVRIGEWNYYNRDGSIKTVERLDENGNLAMDK